MLQVRAVQGIGVEKDRHGLVERDAVFRRVGLGLARVPLEHLFSIYGMPGHAEGLCHLAGGELEQIQFILGHVSVQTTERYHGCKQKLGCAVNDRLGIEPDAAA
jgi:hypothetical protein